MSHLPPQNPNNDPHIQGAGHPRNTPTPVPYGRYNPPVGQTSAAGFGSIDPVLMEVQRKRSATRKVSVAGGIIGLITMIIQMIFTTTFLALLIAHGEYDLPFGFFALFVVLVTPYIVGIAWVATFILALIACIRVHSRTPQDQPDGWVEAKMPTSALLAASIVAGLPAFIVCVVWPLMSLSGSALEPLLVVCALVEVLIAVGFIVLLRKSKALDPTVRAS
ncbi:hypothetical protein HMPREF0059_01703 [Actinomyces viscosus C505]|uniref:Uncharacterized protein n=1 Tax=Actinomyces viscosus C505 TaxID=562973 RepID=F2UZ31_ACTVI|nr:hypothetical protein HMPREF0059_01703 [Actinomyces viscosus C505]